MSSTKPIRTSNMRSSAYIIICITPTIFFFFFNDTPTTEIYTLSLHDALPISRHRCAYARCRTSRERLEAGQHRRSEEHTSELQSQFHLVCRLLLEKKN